VVGRLPHILDASVLVWYIFNTLLLLSGRQFPDGPGGYEDTAVSDTQTYAIY